MNKPPKEGQYVYRAGYAFLNDKKIEVDRQVVLESREGRLVIGESRQPSSTVFSGFRRPDEYRGLHETPEAAVEEFFDTQLEWDRQRIGDLEKEIDEVKRHMEWLRKFDRSKVKVVSKPDGWEPCSY